MTRTCAALAAIALAAPSAAAQPAVTPPAPRSPVIELVTMGVGGLIWERHGHIAMCVTAHGLGALATSARERGLDPMRVLLSTPPEPDDACYNYGIGDFAEPIKMTWGFFHGTNSFWVGKMPPRDMLWTYIHADRTVWVQPLALTDAQKAQVIRKLEYDILDEHRYYAYDHFADNCTTRTRDILDDATDHALAKMVEPTDGKTFRDLAREGFVGMAAWSKASLLITDIAMGRSTDRVPTYWERMFLPQYLREAVKKRFGVEPLVIYERIECRGSTVTGCRERGAPLEADGPSGRWQLVLAIVLLTLPAWLPRAIDRVRPIAQPWRRRLDTIGVVVAVVPYALLGTILLFLAIISPLPYVRWNESLLVLVPFDVLLFALPAGKRRSYARARVAMLGVVALLALVGLLSQPILEEILWPLVPAAVVGFWPARVDAARELESAPVSRRTRRRA